MIRLILSLSMVSLIALLGAPVATAQQSSTPSSSRPSGSNSSGKSSAPPKAAAPCTDGATPPAIPPGVLKEPVPAEPPPLPVPETAVGGDRMGECRLVLPPNAPPPPDGLAATSWLIADQNTGDVLASNAPHARQHPASLVKVLLAMVVLRDLNPNTTVVGAPEDEALTGKVGIKADVKYTVKDLVRALIVTQANDAASALARELGGEQETLDRMNDLAQRLGATDTRATNVTGLDAPGMSTSAYDAALIYREAMSNPTFAEASGSKKVAITPQSGRTKKEFSRTNDNRLLSTYEGATGGKPGLTDAAKSTFVGSAERNGRHLVVSLLRTEKTKDAPFGQAAALLDYGFSLVTAGTAPVGKLVGEIDAAKGQQDAQPQAPDEDSEALAMRRSAFGNVGLPITIAAGVAVLVAVMLAFRRRMARARRARMSQPIA